MPEMIKTKSAKHAVDPRTIHEFVKSLVEEDMHAQRVFSLATGVVGVMHAATASIHGIGLGLAAATGRESKHAIKQVDRLLSNRGIDVPDIFGSWVPYVLGDRKDALVVLDWTDFDADSHATIALNMVTSHGRATPLMWRTFEKRLLKDRRNEYEDELLDRLREIVPRDVRMTILADRGFGDQKMYTNLAELGFDYIVRFRECIVVRDPASASPDIGLEAGAYVPANGRVKEIANALVTQDKTRVAKVVCVKSKGMKEPWCLASSRSDLKGSEIVALYSRRFTIEENFRDTKDIRFGLGLSATHIKSPTRRDRLLLLVAIAQALLTLLGAAAEAEGLDRHTKANTVKRRTHSLYRQGCMWYQLLPTLRDDWFEPLMKRFGEIVSQHAVFTELFGIL